MHELTHRAIVMMKDAIGVLEMLAAVVETEGNRMKDDQTIKPAEIAEFYFHLRENYETLDKAAKRVYHVHDMMNKFLIPERMQAEGVSGIKVPSIERSFSVQPKTSASFVDKEKGFEWLRSIGQGDLIQETVNSGTLASFCRNLILEQGIEPPAEVIKMNTYNTTGMVKYRPKAGAL